MKSKNQRVDVYSNFHNNYCTILVPREVDLRSYIETIDFSGHQPVLRRIKSKLCGADCACGIDYGKSEYLMGK